MSSPAIIGHVSLTYERCNRRQVVSSLECKAAVAFRMSLILCSLDAFHMRLGAEYRGTPWRCHHPYSFPCTSLSFFLTSATHNSSAHRVCLSSEIGYRPKPRRRRRRPTKETSPRSYENWAAVSSARPHDVSASPPAYLSEELRGRKHTKKRLQLASVPKARITTFVTRPAFEDAARRMPVIQMLSALRATLQRSRLRRKQHRNLLRAR